MYQSVFALYLAFVVLIIYFSTEQWWWHSSQAMENRFWGCWSVMVMLVILYSPDSPAMMLMDYRTWYVDFLLCYMSFVFMRGFVRWQEQKHLGKVGTPFSILFENTDGDWYLEEEVEFSDFSRKPSVVAVQTSEDITSLVRKLQYNIASTTARALSNKGIIDSEESIIFALASVADADLSRIVTHINMPQLVFNVRDHFRFSDKKHKEELLDLLCVRRLNVLDPAARSALLNALLVSDTVRTHPRGAEWAKHVLCNTTGMHLHLMKLMLDNTGTYHSLHKLVYTDITDPTSREEILQHIAREGAEFKQNLENDIMLSKPADPVTSSLLPFADLSVEARRKQAPYIKIFSDVDDTLYCSGGDGIAGVDKAFPRKVIYPGVLHFYKQLEIGADDELGVWADGRLGNLVFLSARPHLYKDVSERASYSLFNRLRKEKGLHCTPTMLAGHASMETVTAMTMARGKGLYLAKFEPIRDKKLQNYMEFIKLWPEYTSVFIGDNGQGDVMVAAAAIELGCPVQGAFIHKVLPIEQTFGYEEGIEEKWDKMGIKFFKTYVGAAVLAYEQGLISEMGLQDIAERARSELVHVLEHTPLTGRGGWPIDARRSWVAQFNEDLMAANEYVMFNTVDEIPLPELPPAPVTPVPSVLSATEADMAEAVSDGAAAAVAAAATPAAHVDQEAVKSEVFKAVKSALTGLLPGRSTSEGNVGALQAVKDEVTEAVHDTATGNLGQDQTDEHGRETTIGDLASEIAVEVMENVQGAVTKVAAAVEGAMVQVKRADHAEGDAHVSESKGGVSETTAPANSS